MKHKKTKLLNTLVLAGCILAGPAALVSSVSAETKQEVIENEREAREYAPDNTGRNARDANEHRRTADDQGVNAEHTEVLANIRREIVKNTDLSTYAKNVKIVVEDGLVTLRGPVKTAQEKTWIGTTAGRIASGYRVENQIEIAPG